MNRRLALSLLLLIPTLASCEPQKAMTATDQQPAKMPEVPAGAETATLGAGCFWCIEAAYRQLDGVYSVTSGYMGGTSRTPLTSRSAMATQAMPRWCMSSSIPRKSPTRRSSPGSGTCMTRPRSTARAMMSALSTARPFTTIRTRRRRRRRHRRPRPQANFKDPIVTEITKASEFYPAENYHQNYYNQNKSKNSYCRFVIEPKLKKLKLDH